jgi:hypothetical protein
LDLVGSFVSFFHVLSTDLSDGALVGFGVGFFVGFGVGQSSESESLSDPLPDPESIFSALLFAPNHHAVGGRVDSSVFFVGLGVGQSCLDLVGSFVSLFHVLSIDLSDGALVGFGVGFFVGLGVGQSLESESLSDPLSDPESIFSALLFAPNHHAVGYTVGSFVGSFVGATEGSIRIHVPALLFAAEICSITKSTKSLSSSSE